MRKNRPTRRARWCCALLVAALHCLWLSQARAASTGEGVLIKGVPHVQQKRDFCGEACVAMYLQKLGHEATQDDVFNLSGVDPALGRGCVTRELAQVLERIGFKPGPVWFKIVPTQAASRLEAQWQAMLAGLRDGLASRDGVPSIVCMHTDGRPGAAEHFRLVLGYDAESDEVIYHEPAEASRPATNTGAYRRMKRATFLELWPLKYSDDEWTVVRMSLKPGKLDLGKRADGFTNADFAQHVMALKPSVPEGFTLVVQPPFVVIGDERPAVVQGRAENTVKWFSDHVRTMYFKKDPPAIYDIWLFRDDTSYRTYAKALFDDEPETPYGYFSRAHGALVMNIGTGGGTLCHEMVHAFMPSNFPDCPAWFNEGMGSLYEQCSERGGRLVGLTNWRLAGLKKEIRAGSLPSFKTLLSTTTREFYEARTGNTYAQARYLCYYLQQQGLLVKYYQAFVKNVEDDPAGYKTLMQILGAADEDEMKAFQASWEKWVLELHFP
jgi:hypothetical protein